MGHSVSTVTPRLSRQPPTALPLLLLTITKTRSTTEPFSSALPSRKCVSSMTLVAQICGCPTSSQASSTSDKNTITISTKSQPPTYRTEPSLPLHMAAVQWLEVATIAAAVGAKQLS